MKTSLATLIALPALLTTPLLTHAADYYVAPTGDDANAGSLEKPFATLTAAQQHVAPGDTVYLRGGTYTIEPGQIAEEKGIFAYVIQLDRSGTEGKPITYRAYQDEKPVFDFSRVKPQNHRVYAFSVTGDWLHLVGLDVTGVQVTIKEHTQSICFESNGSHNVFERLTMHDNQAIGIYHVRGSDNLFLNCDAWNNWDSTSEGGRGANVDGFGCHPRRGGTGNVFRGCRAWFNSDDGFDLIGAAESVTFDHCWAFYNGYSHEFESLGDGNGFKAGGYARRPADQLPNPIPRHVIRFCIAVGNKANGFYANHHPGGSDWFNNTAYRNGTNFNMLGRLIDPPDDVDGYGHKLRNNVSFAPRKADIANFDPAKNDSVDNSFDLNLKLTNSSWLSLNEGQLTWPRGADGTLPYIDFLRPAPDSSLAHSAVATGDSAKDRSRNLGAVQPRNGK